MTTRAYVLTRFLDPNQLLPAVEGLKGSPLVRRWDAVDGTSHLVIKIETDSADVPDDLRKLDGVAGMHVVFVEQDDDPDAPLDPALRHSYLYLETDGDRRDDVRTALKQEERVLFCSPTSGECDLVALVRGTTFDDVSRYVDTRVRTRDGVLRVRQDWVLNLTTV